MIGMIAGRQPCRNTSTTMTTSDHRLVDGLDQLVDRLRDEFGRVVADVVVEPLRKLSLSFAIVSEMPFAVASAFEPGRWVTSIATAVCAA